MLVEVKIPPNFLPPFRIEYDGKDICLYGRNANCPMVQYGIDLNEPEDYDETLIPSNTPQIRRANPFIKEVADGKVIIDLNKCKHHPFDRDVDINENLFCTVCGKILSAIDRPRIVL